MGLIRLEKLSDGRWLCSDSMLVIDPFEPSRDILIEAMRWECWLARNVGDLNWHPLPRTRLNPFPHGATYPDHCLIHWLNHSIQFIVEDPQHAALVQLALL